MNRFCKLRDDTGAMLIFALLIVTTIALVTGLILAQGGTNFAATVTLRNVVSTSYSADAAAKVAINDLRLGEDAADPGAVYPPVDPSDPNAYKWVYADGPDEGGCFGSNDDGSTTGSWDAGDSPRNRIDLPSFYPESGDGGGATSATVVCQKVEGTGLFGSGPPISGSNKFARALTTLGTSDGDGLWLEGNADLQMRGGIASKSFVLAEDPQTHIHTDGYVRSKTGCGNGAGTINSDPAPECGSGVSVTDPPVISDPLSAVPPYRDPAQGNDCLFLAGYYNDAAALTAATDNCSLEPAVFQPGDYYFDFKDDDVDDRVWQINHTLIGGTPKGSVIPGRCHSPIDEDNSSSNRGVQFVFGGHSRIGLGNDALVELCGTFSSSAPPVVIRQQVNGTTPDSGTRTLKAATVSTTGTSSGTNWSPTSPAASDVANADTTAAVWTVGNAKKDAKLNLSGLTPSPAIPAGATLTSATLRVRHSESGTEPAPLRVEVKQGATVLVPAAVPTGWATRGSLAWDTVDLTDVLAPYGSNGTISPTVVLSQSNVRNMTQTIDAVEIQLSYQTAVLTPGERVKIVSNGSGSSFQGAFVLQGATYIPNATIDLDVGTNAKVMAFRYGIVAWGVHFRGLPQYLYGYPLVSIPDQGPGFGRNVTAVDLFVYVCPDASSCTDDADKLELKVRVKITDNPASDDPPEPGKRKIEVLSWADLR